MVAVVVNGFDGVDDNISSGGIGRGDTMVSSTFGGNDTVSIFSPSYDVHLGEGNDVLAGGIGGFAYGEAGNDRLTAFLWEGVHRHDGGAGDDRLQLFYGGTGVTYSALGGAGQDRFEDFGGGAESALSFDGGAGYDVVTHSGTAALTLVLNGSGSQNLSTRSYVRIEGAVGANGNDNMTGNGQNNLLVGGGGSDVISGGNGDDFLIGEGRDALFTMAWMGINTNFSAADAFDPLNLAFSGAYATDTGAMNDTLYGGQGNDVLSGGDGADLLNGGNGLDWVTYQSQTSGPGVTLSLTSGGTGGHAAGDVFVQIENVLGSNQNDTIEGNGLGNVLRGALGQDSLSGLAGNDTVLGEAGRDTLSGGAGADELTGGDGEDAFVFGGNGVLAAVDVITDFQTGFDDIWLSAAVFRKLGLAGIGLDPAAFALGSVALDVSDRILYDATTGALSYDSDGNRSRLAVQFAQLDAGLALTAADFLIVA